MEQLYITVEEAARILGVGPRQIQRMVKEGKLRAKNINAAKGIRNYYRILKADVTEPDTI